MTYSDIYKHISHILKEFRTIPWSPEKPEGLTAKQIAAVMEKIGEPWPDVVIAETIQKQLSMVEKVDFSIEEVMAGRYSNLDVRKIDRLFYEGEEA